MENPTSPSIETPAPHSKIGFIAISISLLLIGLVAGYFAGKQELNPVAEQTATPTPSPTELQTYRDEEYGFEFQYPEKFKRMDHDEDNGLLFESDEGHFWITGEENSANLDAEGVQEKYQREDSYGYQYQESFPEIAGVKSFKQGRYDLGVIEYYTIPAYYFFTFSFEFNFPQDSAKATRIQQEIRTILSTFHFIN